MITKRTRRYLSSFSMLLLAALFLVILTASEGWAKCKGCCNGCLQCTIVNNVNNHTNSQFNSLQEWMLNDFWGRSNGGAHTVRAQLKAMVDQLTSVGVALPQQYGAMTDAKLTQETSEDLKEIKYNAVQNAKPSNQLCEMASISQGTTASKQNSKLLQQNLLRDAQNKQLAKSGTPQAGGPKQAAESRMAAACDTYSPTDNNSGLDSLCGGAAEDTSQNCDIDFGCFADKSTLAFDPNSPDSSPDVRNMSRFMQNVFGPETMPTLSRDALMNEASQFTYLDKRSLTAKRSVPQFCFSRVMSQKAQGSPEGAEQMRALLVKSGMPEEVAAARVADNPSLAERISVNTKNLASTSDFYVDIAGREADIKRKQAALQQTNLLLAREMAESAWCSELMLSLIAESSIAEYQENVTNQQGAQSSEN